MRSLFLPYQYKPGYDFFSFEMTSELANFIKDLRVRDPWGYTWRAVAREVAQKYPHLNILSGNQIDGMDLCDYAMHYLNETYEDGWN